MPVTSNACFILFYSASVLDHSCKPNAVAVFSGTTAHIRCIQPVGVQKYGPNTVCSEKYIVYKSNCLLQKKNFSQIICENYLVCNVIIKPLMAVFAMFLL